MLSDNDRIEEINHPVINANFNLNELQKEMYEFQNFTHQLLALDQIKQSDKKLIA